MLRPAWVSALGSLPPSDGFGRMTSVLYQPVIYGSGNAVSGVNDRFYRNRTVVRICSMAAARTKLPCLATALMSTLRLREHPNTGQSEPHPSELRQSKALSKEYGSKERQRDDLAHAGHHGTLSKPVRQQANVG